MSDINLANALFDLSKALGGHYAEGDYWDWECVREAIRRLNNEPAEIIASHVPQPSGQDGGHK